jgi:hypothetical protein
MLAAGYWIPSKPIFQFGSKNITKMIPLSGLAITVKNALQITAQGDS